MKKNLSLYITFIIISSISTLAQAAARDTIKIVGSSTVYPFATVVAERFGKKTEFNTPVIESTGSGGGLKLFCKGIGVEHPDITNASRRIKQSEIDSCAKAGINEITEIKIGYDGIVIANSRKGQNLSLTKRQIFLALSPMIPSPSGKEVLVANPNKTWSDVDTSLPNIAIEVLGPPPSSGTRDAFAELAMEGGCKTFKWLADIKKQDKYIAVSKPIGTAKNSAIKEINIVPANNGIAPNKPEDPT